MSNPYISRGPVRTPGMFFGRRHELNEIAAFVRGNQSVSVIGLRKIGKTSLLFHLMRPEVWPEIGLGSDNLFVYLDCEILGESKHEEVFCQFAQEMIESLQAYGLPPEPALETVVAKPTRLAFESAVRKLNQRGLRVVLILDEFERLSLNTNLDVNFFNALRSAAGRYQLVFITASGRPLIELTYSERSREILSSPFFNIFAPHFLGLLSADEAYKLICEPSQAEGIEFSAEMAEFLYRLAGGHPLALQVACFHAFEFPNEPAEVERCAMRELSSHFQYYWHNLETFEQQTLRQLTLASTRAVSDTTMRAALRDLVQKCLLITDSGTYRYPSLAWANFVSSQHNNGTSPVGRGLSGAQFGAYEVQDLIGRGGMAEVYRGRHTRLHRTVAIKVLSANLASEDDFRRRFEREARAIATLRHPNIVQVFDFGDVDGIYYMVMEFVAGQSLSAYLKEVGALPLETVCGLVRNIADALDYAHAQGLVHRDVKPSNVMLQPGNSPDEFSAILTDFGIAKLMDPGTDISKTEGLTGTLDYIAPEQIRSSGEVDGRADVYALGVMIYQMLTGRLPFTSDNPGALLLAHLEELPPDPRDFNPALPENVSVAVHRAMAKNPDVRFATAGALIRALV